MIVALVEEILDQVAAPIAFSSNEKPITGDVTSNAGKPSFPPQHLNPESYAENVSLKANLPKVSSEHSKPKIEETLVLSQGDLSGDFSCLENKNVTNTIVIPSELEDLLDVSPEAALPRVPAQNFNLKSDSENVFPETALPRVKSEGSKTKFDETLGTSLYQEEFNRAVNLNLTNTIVVSSEDFLDVSSECALPRVPPRNLIPESDAKKLYP